MAALGGRVGVGRLLSFIKLLSVLVRIETSQKGA